MRVAETPVDARIPRPTSLQEHLTCPSTVVEWAPAWGRARRQRPCSGTTPGGAHVCEASTSGGEAGRREQQKRFHDARRRGDLEIDLRARRASCIQRTMAEQLGSRLHALLQWCSNRGHEPVLYNISTGTRLPSGTPGAKRMSAARHLHLCVALAVCLAHASSGARARKSIAESDFRGGDDSWTTKGGQAEPYKPDGPLSSTLTVRGNGNEWWFIAPPKFLGDKVPHQ